jgi:type VI secretion system protein ImpK
MPESMPLLLQEPLAATARVRRGKRVSDADFFRKSLIENFKQAEEKARGIGYSGKDTKLAIFAVAALIDETVLGSTEAAFAEWHRQPLCLQIFGTNLGGEIFFDNIRLLLEREPDSHTADVLEVHLLCLLLGFAGKHKSNDAPEIRQLTRTIRERIDRIRRATYTLPGTWSLPEEPVAQWMDPFITRLKIGAAIAAGLAVGTFVFSKLHLGSALNTLQNLAGLAERFHG